MKVCHVAASQSAGGAAKAGYRIHQSILDFGKEYDVESFMRVAEKGGSSEFIKKGQPHRNDFKYRLFAKAASISNASFQTPFAALHSYAWPDTGMGKELNKQNWDIVNLHWLGNNTISIEEIGRIASPLAWTLHDQWAFSGAEHYESFDDDSLGLKAHRYQLSYCSSSRPSSERGFDLNRQTWLRKKRSWRRQIHIVCPSNWMASCARSSALMADWPVSVVPYPIDTSFWQPLPSGLARQVMGLDQDKIIIAFGATGGLADSRKGGDLFLQAIQIVLNQCREDQSQRLQFLIFGQVDSVPSLKLHPSISMFGELSDDYSLRAVYSASDLFVLPSRQDNLPLTGLEAHACGTPVVGFSVGGLVDIIDHHQTGALAQPFDPESLASEILWCINDSQRRSTLGMKARLKAEMLWNPLTIAKSYTEIYHSLVT